MPLYLIHTVSLKKDNRTKTIKPKKAKPQQQTLIIQEQFNKFLQIYKQEAGGTYFGDGQGARECLAVLGINQESVIKSSTSGIYNHPIKKLAF